MLRGTDPGRVLGRRRSPGYGSSAVAVGGWLEGRWRWWQSLCGPRGALPRVHQQAAAGLLPARLGIGGHAVEVAVSAEGELGLAAQPSRQSRVLSGLGGTPRSPSLAFSVPRGG